MTSYRVWLTRDSLELSKVWLYDEEGNVRSEGHYADYVDGLPRRVTILRPVEGYRAVFELEKVETGRSFPAQVFTGQIPDNYEVTVLE